MDDLFGMGEIKKKERVDEYLTKDYEIFLQEDDRPEQRIKRVTLWREAQKEFPNNHTVLMNLVWALNYPDCEPSDNYEEIIQIGERLIAESTDNDIRANAIYTLCNVCALKKDFENAKRYANMAMPYYRCKEILYGRCLTGEEHIEYRQRCITDFIKAICMTFIGDLIGTDDINSIYGEKAIINLWEFALNLYHFIYPDGDFGDDERSIAHICHVLTNFYSGVDNDKALYYLDEVANHEVKCWTQGEFKHTSFIVNGLNYSYSGDRSKDTIRKFVGQTIQIIEEAKYLDPIRNNKRYTAAMDKLKNLVK